MSKELFKRLLNDIRVDVADEFDKNFDNKAFFDQPWPANKFNNRKGSMMIRSTNLKRSILSSISGNNIHFSSSAIYADIHNNGGKIKVTAKMKRFFWAMYYKNSNAMTYKVSTKKAANTKKNTRLSAEAEMWKAMALKKVGSVITIPQRQFIGTHQKVHDSINRAAAGFFKNLEIYVDSLIKKR